jgi:hypothetical protein
MRTSVSLTVFFKVSTPIIAHLKPLLYLQSTELKGPLDATPLCRTSQVAPVLDFILKSSK